MAECLPPGDPAVLPGKQSRRDVLRRTAPPMPTKAPGHEARGGDTGTPQVSASDDGHAVGEPHDAADGIEDAQHPEDGHESCRLALL